MSTSTQTAPWWWREFVVGFFCLVAVVLGSLDHFLAHDSWGVFDTALILAGLTGGGVAVGRAWALPTMPPAGSQVASKAPAPVSQ
jgi:hypothetical protein